MNDSEFEKELGRLVPAAPSASLEHRIAAALRRQGVAAEPEKMPAFAWLGRWLDRLVWTGAGAVAALALMLAVQRGPQGAAQTESGAVAAAASPVVKAPVSGDATPVTTPVPGSTAVGDAGFQPLLTSSEAGDWQEEGVTFDKSGQPVMKLRRTAVDHQAWADPQNAGVVHVEQPRQEVIYVPVPIY